MKSHKGLLVFSIILFFAGLFVTFFSLTLMKTDFKDINIFDYKEKEFIISDDIQSINVNTDIDRVRIMPTDDKKTVINCQVNADGVHKIKSDKGILNIDFNNKNDALDVFNYFIARPVIYIYLPKDSYDDLLVKTKFSDVTIDSKLKFDDMSVTTKYGNITNASDVNHIIKLTSTKGEIKLYNVECGGAKLYTHSRDIYLRKVKSKGTVEAKSAKGKVVANDLKCKEYISTDNN